MHFVCLGKCFQRNLENFRSPDFSLSDSSPFSELLLAARVEPDKGPGVLRVDATVETLENC